LKASDLDAASAVFRHLEEQAARLADGEARRMQLLAMNERLGQQIEESEALADRLRHDLQRHTSQEHVVTARQHQVRKEVAQLEAQRVAAQAQLNKAHRLIHQLSVATSEGVPHLPGR
jgi:K+/H+ antiporter YhaU regulatory subunit KhtT